MNIGITEEQGRRILEDLQRLALSCKVAEDTMKLIRENAEAVGRDVQGMLNGNSKNNSN